MNLNNMKWVVAMMAAVGASQALAAESPKTDVTTQSFSVKLGATRVVYDPDSSGATLSVSNPQDYPMLVQTHVTGEDKKSAAPFVVTPPLFRLDGQQQSRMRIVRTGGDFPKDRESMEWVCVTGIPPKADDAWAADDAKAKKEKRVSLDVQLSISSCIKLLVRPSAVKGGPESVAGQISWARQGGKLVAKNPTPFYMSLSGVTLGGKTIQGNYVPPFGTRAIEEPKGAGGNDIHWKVVTDYGGESQEFRAVVK